MNNVDTPHEVISQGDVSVIAPIQNHSTIEIGTVETLIGFGVLILVAGIAWGTLRNSVSNISKTLETNLVPDLKNVRERFNVVEDRVDTIWKDKFAPAHSPRQLNDRGKKVLENSGIKNIIDSKAAVLLDLVKKKNPSNAYDAEAVIEKIMMEMPKHCPDIVEELKTGAFKTGTDVGAILFVGSIYLRNTIFKDLGFSLNDLDIPNVTKT